MKNFEKQRCIRKIVIEQNRYLKPERIQEILKERGVTISVRQIQRDLKQLRELGKHEFIHRVEQQEGQGRKQIYTEQEKQKIVEYMDQNRRITNAEIQRDKNINFKQVDIMTIQRISNEYGFVQRVAKRTFLLTKSNKKKRIQWAFKYSDKSQRFWNRVLFSDESKLFCQYGGKIYIRKKNSESWNNDEFIEQQQPFHGGKEIMVFGVIGVNGGISFQKVPGRLNSRKYQKLLKDDLLQNEKFDKEKHIFQQDLAKSHTSKSTKQFLKQERINLLDWFPKGCDVSIIEQVWAKIKDHLYQNRDIVKNKDDIFDISEKYFFSQEMTNFIKKLYKSIISRVEYLKNQQGERVSFD